MKQSIFSLLLLIFSFVHIHAESSIIPSDLLLAFERKAQEIIEPIKELDSQEVQALVHFLSLSRLMAFKDIELRRHLDLFLESTLKLQVITNKYEESADIVKDSSIQLNLKNLHDAFEDRNQTYKLWKFAEDYLNDNASGTLSLLIDSLRGHGQEAFLQFINECKEVICLDIVKLKDRRQLIGPYLKVNTAINSLQLVVDKEIDGLPMVNVLWVVSDLYYKAACESLELAMHLKEYMLLSEKFAHRFYSIYCKYIYAYLNEHYPQQTAPFFEIRDGNCVVNVQT